MNGIHAQKRFSRVLCDLPSLTRNLNIPWPDFFKHKGCDLMYKYIRCMFYSALSVLLSFRDMVISVRSLRPSQCAFGYLPTQEKYVCKKAFHIHTHTVLA